MKMDELFDANKITDFPFERANESERWRGRAMETQKEIIYLQ